MYRALFLLTALLLTSCQPTTLEDFQAEGSSVVRALLQDLRRIDGREDLAYMEPILKKDFERLVDIIIQARVFQQKNPELEAPFQNINATLNQSLIDELKRVYEIEGGRESVERSQREAMLRLDAKEKMIEKQQSIIRMK